MLHLIDDVLDLVRLELGRYLLDLRFENVNPVAEAAVDSVRHLADGKRVTIQVALDGSIPNQHLDPAKMRQAITHLLRNAIRFSPPKAGVRLSTSVDDEGVTIEVRDAGPPIQSASTSSLFELEIPADALGARSKEGLGLGLHLTRRFVELHGGSVGAGPTPEGGAAFWIRLPRGEDLASILGSDPFVEELARQ
jgi:signal transduction histidine kinase